MKSVAACSVKAGVWLLAVFCAGGLSAFGGGNIDPTNKYAWAENAGWLNFSPTNGGVTVVVSASRYLSGYAWAENIGWIRLGNDNGGPYQNTAANDWGVNIVAGKLTGYAWSENCGWIKFNPTHSEVTLSWNDGWLAGYAWAENVGWVHFRNAAPAYGVQTTAKPPGTIVILR